MARLEIGEVLLTASIRLIQGSVFLGVMTTNISPSQFGGEILAGQTGKLGGFAEREYLLLIKRHRQFIAMA